MSPRSFKQAKPSDPKITKANSPGATSSRAKPAILATQGGKGWTDELKERVLFLYGNGWPFILIGQKIGRSAVACRLLKHRMGRGTPLERRRVREATRKRAEIERMKKIGSEQRADTVRQQTAVEEGEATVEEEEATGDEDDLESEEALLIQTLSSDSPKRNQSTAKNSEISPEEFDAAIALMLLSAGWENGKLPEGSSWNSPVERNLNTRIA